MNITTTPLEHAHRDALVAWYLGQLVPDRDGSIPDAIITPEDLYEYLLIDNQVSIDVDTSRVAAGIASIQQHIHAIYNGMEPGFGEVADNTQHQADVQHWHESMSQYSQWAGYQMLADYPENYLDPSLRLGKTDAFKAFESELAQARLTPDNVQKALGTYLTRFEAVANLRILCCYIDGTDFRRADYYFVGRSVMDPAQFYWRKVAMDLDDSSTHVPSSAWTEWKPINANTGDSVTHVRLAVVEGRLHLVWMEQVRQKLDADDKPVANQFVYRLSASYLLHDGERWSDAIHLLDPELPSVATLDSERYSLVVTFDGRHAATPRLVVCLMQYKEELGNSHLFFLVRDKYWQPVRLSAADQTSVITGLSRQLGDVSDSAQYRLEGGDAAGKVWTLKSATLDEQGDTYPGVLSRYLEIDASIKMVDGACYTELTGRIRKPWYTDQAFAVPYQGMFGIWRNVPRSEYSMTLNGDARTPLQVDAWISDASDANLDILRFGSHDKNSGLGYNAFRITRQERTTAPLRVVTYSNGGVFLDLAPLNLPGLRYVRLNTTFAGELVRKAERSLEGALGWEAQHTAEIPFPGSSAPAQVDFNGANGLYFWELFFHVPHLAAWRLHQSFDYAGAEQWLHFLFDPQVRVAPLYPPPAQTDWLPYWTSRPLAFADDPLRDTAASRDPNVIANGAPSHYRKAIFMLYLDNLIAWGDSLYRQVTRDALNEAKLLYVRALSLLGPLSKGRSISRWEPMTLVDAARREEATFNTFEASGLAGLEQDIPRVSGEEPWLRLVDAPWFRLPVNTRLLDLWDQLDSRLFNLRNNLTLDGQPMSLALYETPANPLDLLRAQLAGSSTSLRRLGGRPVIAPYRFSGLLPHARQAVDTLIRFGEQLHQSLFSRDRAEQELLQQSHVTELTAFVEQLDEHAIEAASKELEVLAAQRAQVQAQVEAYDSWLERDVSDAEKRAEKLFGGSSELRLLASASRAVGYGLSTLPNTFTVLPGPIPAPIPGGWHWSGPFWAAATLADAAASQFNDSADRSLRTDAQNRRRQEWAFLKDQAQKQLDTLAAQVDRQTVSLRAVELKRQRSQMARQQAQALYAFIQNRTTHAALYQWLAGQMATLYFQAYDAVLSLCLATEACWQYETGDPGTTFIPVDAWVDNRQGMTAGESLSLGLLQMESAFLVRHERRLELVKTVSLRTLLSDYQGAEGAPGWAAVIDTLRNDGTVEFQFKPSLFDRDYPGHYLRQLVQVSVSLPGVVGPYENVRMTLSQLADSYLLKPDLGGSKYLYEQAQELEGQHDEVDPRFVLSSARPSQQIAISSPHQDSSMQTTPWEDERYHPFEGTGAVSHWALSFPRHGSAAQQALFDGLQDIIVHVRYRAMDGGKAFAGQIRDLLPDVRRRMVAQSRAQDEVLPPV